MDGWKISYVVNSVHYLTKVAMIELQNKQREFERVGHSLPQSWQMDVLWYNL